MGRRPRAIRFFSLASAKALAITGAATIALAQQTPPPSGAAPSPVPYASVSELNGILDQLKTTSTAIQGDARKCRFRSAQSPICLAGDYVAG
jgi:hypothetical protein